MCKRDNTKSGIRFSKFMINCGDPLAADTVSREHFQRAFERQPFSSLGCVSPTDSELASEVSYENV